jgi:hypothetical protein
MNVGKERANVQERVSMIAERANNSRIQGYGTCLLHRKTNNYSTSLMDIEEGIGMVKRKGSLDVKDGHPSSESPMSSSKRRVRVFQSQGYRS